MICPICESEYIEGITSCPDCQVELVDELVAKEYSSKNVEERLKKRFKGSGKFVKFVSILKTQNSGLLSIAKSILEDAEIQYFAIGENSLDILGMGRIGGFNRVAGSAELKVAEEDFDEANELLKELLEDA